MKVDVSRVLPVFKRFISLTEKRGLMPTFVVAGSLAIVGLLALSGITSAAVLFSDDFEGPYAEGDNTALHTPDVGLQWSASSNSRLRDGSGGFPAPSGSGGTFYSSLNDRIIGQLNAGEIALSTNAIVYTQFDFYVASDTGHGLNYITFAPWPGYRGPDFLLRPDGTFAYYTNASNTYTTDPNFDFTADTWHTASLVVNYGTGAASLKVGAETANFTVADPSSTTVREVYFINYNDHQNVVGVDNIILSTTPPVPEPTMVTMFVTGLVGLICFARRKPR